MVTIKSAKEIQAMKISNQIVGNVLDGLTKLVEPGVSTMDLEQFAEKRCREEKVKPAFKGYHGFPACLCISVNNEVVHGIPSPKRILNEGDIVGIDFGVIVDGWYGDSARTFAVGEVSPEAKKLMKVTKESLFLGIDQCVAGHRLFDIGHAVQNYIEGFSYSVVREFVGHGIGRALHEEPQVPNYGPKGKGMVLKEGMVLAIEPMVNIGSPQVKVLEDGWTAITQDGSLSAHFEHTVAITANGPEILSITDLSSRE